MWPSSFGYAEIAEGLVLGRVGTPEDPGYVGNVVIISGTIDDSGSVDFDFVKSTSGKLPGQHEGEVEVAILDQNGTEISSILVPLDKPSAGNINPDFTGSNIEGGLDSFSAILPDPDARLYEIVVGVSGEELDRLQASETAPTVTLLSPTSAGLDGGDQLNVEWLASDDDGDDLKATVLYSDDNGEKWLPLAVDLTRNNLVLRGDRLAEAANARIKVIVSDGIRSAEDISDSFVVGNSHPTIEILSPVATVVTPGTRILLDAVAWDTEDGFIEPASVNWESDTNGDLGSGSPLLLEAGELAKGCHLVQASVVDSGAANGIATRRVCVGEVILSDGFE